MKKRSTDIIPDNFIEKGKVNIKDVEKQMGQTHQMVTSRGGTPKAVYFTMGRYDVVIIAEFPSEEAVMEA